MHAAAVMASQSMPVDQLNVRTMASCYDYDILSVRKCAKTFYQVHNVYKLSQLYRLPNHDLVNAII